MRDIALLGNMNNAGFCLLRYFRDLGADAYLLPYASDGRGALAHFSPEADTWEIERWAPFIVPMEINNEAASVIGGIRPIRMPVSPATIRATLAPYKRLVGMGIAPALAHRAGRRLDIFYPCTTGIESFGDPIFRSRLKRSFARRAFHGTLRRLQAQGIRNARVCLNAELSLTSASFKEIGKEFLRLPVPAVYNRESTASALPSPRVREALAKAAQSQFSVFAPARHMWVRDRKITAETWSYYTKNNDWLIRGYAEFVRRHRDLTPLLTFVEYGPDVDASKNLAAELGIADAVQWLPVMPRREVLLFHEASDVVAGEFSVAPGLLWGGTGWEALASGRPLLQTFNFTANSYEAEFGHRPPPILDVRSASDIAREMDRILDLADKGKAIGRASAEWFEEHGGIGLARRWLELLDSDRSGDA